jgi:hypothetical protein
MYEVIKFKNAFSGKNEDEIKDILISGSYPKLEESEKLYDKEMIKTINLMLNVCIIFIFIHFYFIFYFFIYYY